MTDPNPEAPRAWGFTKNGVLQATAYHDREKAEHIAQIIPEKAEVLPVFIVEADEYLAAQPFKDEADKIIDRLTARLSELEAFVGQIANHICEMKVAGECVSDCGDCHSCRARALMEDKPCPK